MSLVPIVAHHQAKVSPGLVSRADSLAVRLRDRYPELTISDHFHPLVVEHLEGGPTLHLDDLSAIPELDRFYEVSFIEDRARLRAGDGDYVASCSDPVEPWQRYCTEQLGLGSVVWQYPNPKGNRRAVASACWTDREVRHTLVRAFRSSRLHYIHPHMGSFAVWAVAALLRRASGHPVKVLAPPPGLTRRVNDKIWFARTVKQLLGEAYVPPTAAAYNAATVSHVVRRMAPGSRRIVIKLPDSAGGAGNVILDSARFRSASLGEIRRDLKRHLPHFIWRGDRLLVSAWETEVLCAPSAQLWIPPRGDGPPVVEGLFEQLLEGLEGFFVGSTPARFAPSLSQEIVNYSWLIGYLFQRLGYVGRCSFDMLLVGKDLESCRLEFLECNGRWGGTSLPMTLMNRLTGDFLSIPYATSEFTVPGIEEFRFDDVLEAFGDDLFDVRTGRGHLIPYNPGGMWARPGLDVLAMAESWEDAMRVVGHDVPRRLADLVARGRGEAFVS